MLSLASACEIDGSRLCLFSSADVTQLWEYRNCPGGSTLFANALVSDSIEFQTLYHEVNKIRSQQKQLQLG